MSAERGQQIEHLAIAEQHVADIEQHIADQLARLEKMGGGDQAAEYLTLVKAVDAD